MENTDCPCGSPQKDVYLDDGSQRCKKGHIYHQCIDGSVVYGKKKCFRSKKVCEKTTGLIPTTSFD